MAKRKRSAVLDNWDEVQHDPVSDPPTLLGLSTDEAVDAIKEWFFSNFEDPAESTPYESAEGGYQYIWGGPYDTRDIIENVFYRRTRRAVTEAAIEELDRESFEWVPNSSRRQPPEEDEDLGDVASTQQERHALMLMQIGEIEQLLAQIPELPAGIGHNRPPEPLDIEPLNTEDRAEISSALAVLKSQPVKPDDGGKAAEVALARFETKREKLGNWLAKQGEIFASEAIKEAGKEVGKQFGKWAPRAFWLFLMDNMFGVSHAVNAWLKWLQSSPF